MKTNITLFAEITHKSVVVFLMVFVLHTAFLVRNLHPHKTLDYLVDPVNEEMLAQFTEEQRHLNLQLSRYVFGDFSESSTTRAASGDPGLFADDSADSDAAFEHKRYTLINLPYERRWVDYRTESLDYMNDQILHEQLDRFESSLTEEGRHELENRIQMGIERLQKNEVPGFEGIASNADMTFLTASPETLTPHKKRIRDRIYLRRKKITLMEMHAEYIGLFEDRFSYWK